MRTEVSYKAVPAESSSWAKGLGLRRAPEVLDLVFYPAAKNTSGLQCEQVEVTIMSSPPCTTEQVEGKVISLVASPPRVGRWDDLGT